MASRVKAEGESFFTTTLPMFGKDLEMALAQQRITPELFKGFQRRKLEIDVYTDDMLMCLYGHKKPGGIPQFLGGFLDLLFENTLVTRESNEDKLLNTPAMLVPCLKRRGFDLSQADAVAAIRQLTLMFGKEKERCAPIFVEAAYDTFVETDRSLETPLRICGLKAFSKADGSLI